MFRAHQHYVLTNVNVSYDIARSTWGIRPKEELMEELRLLRNLRDEMTLWWSQDAYVRAMSTIPKSLEDAYHAAVDAGVLK